MARQTDPAGARHSRVPCSSELAHSIGAMLRSARLARQLTLKQVAGMTGLHMSHISRIERGLSKSLSPSLRYLCNLWGISVDMSAAQAEPAMLIERFTSMVEKFKGQEGYMIYLLDFVYSQLDRGLEAQ